jgi:hypothetical protein
MSPFADSSSGRFARVENAESVETSKIMDIGGQQLRDAMDIHAGRQTGVMHLHAWMPCATSRDRQRSWTSRLSGRNSKSRNRILLSSSQAAPLGISHDPDTDSRPKIW